MTDNFDYIERAYGLKFYKGQIVLALGKPGVVTGTSNAYVMVRLSNQRHVNRYHPTDVEPAGGGKWSR